MLKNVTKFEMKIGERSYQFICDSDSPLGQVYDALSEMRGIVLNKINEVENAPKPAQEEQPS